MAGRFRRWWLVVPLLAVIAWWPVTTRQGINGIVATTRLPLYHKAAGLWYRDQEMRRLVRGIVGDAPTPQERVERLWAWSQRYLHAGVPEGWPVIDDHVWHIVVRGYGSSDQLADALATLCTYAGVPAKWFDVRLPDGSGGRLFLVFVRWEGAWRVCDPYHRLQFRHPDGRWATVSELARDPSLVRQAAGALAYGGAPYPAYFATLDQRVDFRRMSRNEIQSPWRRLWFAARSATRLTQ